jgi:hypothetical protein
VLAFGVPPGAGPEDLSRWVAGLAPWGRLLCVRVALAGIELGLPVAPELAPSVSRLTAWCHHPHRGKLLAWASAFLREERHVYRFGSDPDQVAIALHRAVAAAVADGFAGLAATAINRLEIVVPPRSLRSALVDLVRREALGG